VSTLFVCVTCRSGDAEQQAGELRPGARLFATLQRLATNLDIVPVECLSNCQQSCSAAVTAPGKWTYVIGHLDPDRHADDVLSFVRLHDAHPEGLPVWRERPEHIRKNTIARVPPMHLARIAK
jgi:predicted metal-binding protein